MHTVKKNRIQIISPEVKRGHPPRDLTMRDVISVPIDYTRGSWRILDLLDNRSALNVLKIYNRQNAIA